MKITLMLSLVFVLWNLSSKVQASELNAPHLNDYNRIELRDLPVPKNYQESLQTHPQRARLIQKLYLNQARYTLPTNGDKGLEFGQTAIAAALLKDRQALDLISKELSESAYVPPLTGTKITIPVIGCSRDGDYDFLLQYLVTLAILDYKSGEELLSDSAREALEKKYLYVIGGDPTSLTFRMPPCGKFKDTENHILMTEAARYLTNQWRLKRDTTGTNSDVFDNSQNGLEDWLAEHLVEFLEKDFDEFNSKPYESYAIVPIQILASFADSTRIKIIASSILDHLSAKFASLSIASQRHLPFRRQSRFKDDTDLFLNDPQTSRHAILLGHYSFLFNPSGSRWQKQGRFMDGLWASLPGYFPPKEIVESILQESRLQGLQKFSHYNTELAYKSKSFLLSGGGYFERWWGWFTDQNHAWARPATLIPADSSYDVNEIIHFKGHPNSKKRANLCVEEGFLCGRNLYIPPTLESTATIQAGNWTFLTLKSGIHVAIWKKNLKRGNFGFLEAREASEISLDAFMKVILSNNKKEATFLRNHIYTTSVGRKIEFTFYPKGIYFSNIIAVNDIPTIRDTREWKFAEGHLYNQLESKLLEFRGIDNRRWIIDLRNSRAPFRGYLTRGKI